MSGGLCSTRAVNGVLDRDHYLGAYPRHKGWAWSTPEGVMVFANPTSRHLPQWTWLELTRWCLAGEPNAGSRQWAAFVRWARRNLRHVTTFVSYSDPDQGHDGALYRACGWLWAPTWHRLRPAPSGGGSWDGKKQQGPKDRWVYPLRPDADRPNILSLRSDPALQRRFPWAEYQEPTWKRGKPQQDGGGDWARWQMRQEADDAA